VAFEKPANEPALAALGQFVTQPGRLLFRPVHRQVAQYRQSVRQQVSPEKLSPSALCKASISPQSAYPSTSSERDSARAAAVPPF
jgi:hypothetical protein